MDRFKKVYHQGTIEVMEIWADAETGVDDLFHRNEMQQDLHHYLTKTENR